MSLKTISVCAQSIFKCFNAEFVSSSYETVYEENLPSKDEPKFSDMVGLLKDDTEEAIQTNDRIVQPPDIYLDMEVIKAAEHLRVKKGE